jgi:hypothetical protein
MEFKHGAFTMAKEANVQILPIYVHGCQEGHGLNWVCGPTDLTLVYGNPFVVIDDSSASSTSKKNSLEDASASSSSKKNPYENSRRHAKEWMETEMKKLQSVRN